MKKQLLFIVLQLSILVFLLLSCSGGFSFSSATKPSNALSGSYAKILDVGDYLYAINEDELSTFDISDPNEPIEIDMQIVGFDIENIFHNEGVLFIGSQRSLHIYNIEKDGIPKKVSKTDYFEDEQVTSCDPVIVSNNIAYVTLHTITTNSPCRRTISINELRIYDVTILESPVLLSTTSLSIPKGLAIDGKHLFVCLKNKGLQVLDVEDPLNPRTITILEQFESYDVIAKDGLLMIVGPEEIRQYDYMDINNIQYLSSIDI